MELNLQFYQIYSNSYKFLKLELNLELIWINSKGNNETPLLQWAEPIVALGLPGQNGLDPVGFSDQGRDKEFNPKVAEEDGDRRGGFFGRVGRRLGLEVTGNKRWRRGKPLPWLGRRWESVDGDGELGVGGKSGRVGVITCARRRNARRTLLWQSTREKGGGADDRWRLVAGQSGALQSRPTVTGTRSRAHTRGNCPAWWKGVLGRWRVGRSPI
jgi:hypothetical protein